LVCRTRWHGRCQPQRADSNLSPENYLRFSRDGLLMTKTIPQEARVQTLRNVLRDVRSGNLGSISIPPDRTLEQP
jgi:hypothetical protein